MSDAKEPAGGFGAPQPGQRARLEHRPDPPPTPGGRFFAAFGYVAVAIVATLVVGYVVMASRYSGTTTAEAKNTLGQIGKDAVLAYETTGVLCPSTSSVPATLDPIHGRKYQSSKADWDPDPGWTCLGFEMTAPQYYRYRYERAGDEITITALGDLDGDGVLAKFVLHGKADAKLHRLFLDPSIDESNPNE